MCHPSESGRIPWNPTFKAFAEYWGLEPRLCRAYRARTILRPPGVGKTHLAVGLELKGIEAGSRVFFTTAAHMILELSNPNVTTPCRTG